MSSILAIEYPKFEKWTRKTYPDIVANWELEASHLLDLDEWINAEHPGIITEWRNLNKTVDNYPTRQEIITDRAIVNQIISEECANCSYEHPNVCKDCPFGL